MLSKHERAMVRALLESDMPVSQIARRTGRSVVTIYNYQKQFQNPSPTSTFAQASSRSPGGRRYKPAVKVETAPGEQAQVDWGSFGTVMIDGKKEHLYAFFYILSYSRMLYAEFTIRQNQQTLQECHMNAFEALGIPKIIRYDNMKTVVLSHKRNTGTDPTVVFNSAFSDFARYYDFEAFACPPYWPRAKGKVERSVRYIRDAFIPTIDIGREFKNLDVINTQIKEWLQNTANQRIHRSTGKSPLDRYEEEKSILRHPNGMPRYSTSPIESRRSTKDGMVAYKGNYYSIPMTLAGKQVTIREVNNRGDRQVIIYRDYEQIASHRLQQGRGAWIVDETHVNIDQGTKQPVIKSTKQPHRIKKYTVKVEQRPMTYYDRLIERN